MRHVGFGNGGDGGSGAGFEGVVREAVDSGFEGFVEVAPADVEDGGAGPAFLVFGVGCGEGGYFGGGAVGEEGRVGGDVCYEFVEGGRRVGEDTGGCEVLERPESGGGDESSLIGWWYSNRTGTVEGEV